MKKLPFLLAALLCASSAYADDKPGSPSVNSPAPGTISPTSPKGQADSQESDDNAIHLKLPQSPPKTQIEAFLLQKDTLIAYHEPYCAIIDAPDGWTFIMTPIVAYVPGQDNLKAKGLAFTIFQGDTGSDSDPTCYLDLDEAEALSKALLTLSKLKVTAPKAFEGYFTTKSHFRIACSPGFHDGEADTNISIDGHPNIFSWHSNSQLTKMNEIVDKAVAYLKTQ